jgi:dolichol-phosphate mannosyltransferase
MSMPKLTVVLPTYNEAENLEALVTELLALDLPAALSVLVVDDNSPDGTGQIADRLAQQTSGRVRVLHRAAKAGLGPAYIAGFTDALEHGADIVLQMDTDFSHQPRYIPDMLQALHAGADFVQGSRYVRGGGVDEKWGIHRKLLSAFANKVYVRFILGLPINDATGGFRMWRRTALQSLGLHRLKSNGYVFMVELAYLASRLGLKMVEVPIHFPDRQRGTSKMSGGIMVEAALRVWEIRARHRALSPRDRLPA